MINHPKVSLVMPVYNGEGYLSETLDDLLSQTLQDFELICIDDGSTDASHAILQKFHAQDPRIQVFRQNNAGVSAARNVGLRHATGKYVMFCDDDDLFANEMLEKMTELMEAHDADICVPNGYKLDMADGSRIIEPNFIRPKYLPSKECFTPKDAGKYLFQFSTFHIYKMYRLSFLREHEIAFGTQKADEDGLFFAHALIAAQRIVATTERLFYYRVNTGSSVSDSIFREDILAGYEGMLLLKELLQQYRLLDDEDFHQSYVNRALAKTIDYRRRAKDFRSLSILFETLANQGGLAKMDLLGHEAEYYFNQTHFEELEALESSKSVEDYLFFLFNRSQNALKMKSETVKDLKKEVSTLKRQNAEQKREYTALRQNSLIVNARLKRLLYKLRHPIRS